MRIVALLVLAAGVAIGATELFRAHGTWAAPLAVLLIGGGVITCSLVLRNWASRPRRSRTPLPPDPGFPHEPLGAPYRGPRY